MRAEASAGVQRAGRWVGALVALLLAGPSLLAPAEFHALDHVNLIFHEAGHMLLMPLGETVMLLGGSLMQLLVPLACGAAFLTRGDRYAAGLMGVWAGQSLANVSAYVADARDRALPLITGDPDTHDWWQLLGGWGALDAAPGLARLLLALAFALVVASVLLALWGDLSEPVGEGRGR